jgi:hypothetical protein
MTKVNQLTRKKKNVWKNSGKDLSRGDKGVERGILGI